jgi:hypothetical protein
MTNEKKFIIKKFVFAKNALDAIRKDKRTPVDDVYVDGEWMMENDKKNMGFTKAKAD